MDFFECVLSNSGRRARLGLVIPTLNAGERWRACLEGIKRQSCSPERMLIVDSSSTDRTTALALSAGFEIIRIARSEFNHGGTRQQAAEYLSDCGIIIFLTQDAIPASPSTFAEIVDCFEDASVAVAYGRQLPHLDATSIESHSRIYNYGAMSLRKNAASAEKLGAKVFFCSNSFSAYRRSILMELGGFRRDLILGEDMEFAARAIQAGYANFYCATAPVYHSHDYTARQTFARYFDIGAFDDTNGWMRERFGSHRGEGSRFVASELRYLSSRNPAGIPRALFQTTAKAIGYRAGRCQRLLPRVVKRKISLMSSYWA
jgi:rhamnosyltransferase